MAKKDKNDDEAAGEPEVKLTAVTTLLPDPNDAKHNPNLLVETLRKAPAKNHPRARSDAALFLWDLALNDPDARARMCTEEFAGACQVALQDGDVSDRSATASLVREAVSLAEARPVVAAASGLVERLCDVLDDRRVADRRASPTDPAASSKKHASATHAARSRSATGDADVASARAAAAEALRELTSTSQLRGVAAPAPKKGKPPRVRLDVLVRAADASEGPERRSPPTDDDRRVATACLETLHQCMDPARNKDASAARADAFGDAKKTASSSSDQVGDAASTTLGSTLAVFSAALLDADAPPEARRAAAWCLAHGTHDEHRRDAVLADPAACLNLRRALRRRDADFATRAGVAAAVANLAAVSVTARGGRVDDGETSVADARIDADVVPPASVSDPRLRRARAVALEGRLGSLKKIPKDELKPADAEEKAACVAELKTLARTSAGELVGAVSGAERDSALLARRRVDRVFESMNPLGPLCRLVAPPGAETGDASETDAEEEDGAEESRVVNVAAKTKTAPRRDRDETTRGDEGDDDAATRDDASVSANETTKTKASSPTDGGAPSGDAAPEPPADVVPADGAADGASSSPADGAGDVSVPVGATQNADGDAAEHRNAPEIKADDASSRVGASFAVGQAEAIAAAAAALRRLTARPDARAAAKLVSSRAHAHMLWHLSHSKDVATRRDCRETLRQLARDEAARAAIEAVADAPALASRAFVVNPSRATAAVLAEEENERLDALVPGIVASSARRRPEEEVRAARAAAYRARGAGVREAP